MKSPFQDQNSNFAFHMMNEESGAGNGKQQNAQPNVFGFLIRVVIAAVILYFVFYNLFS